MKLDKDGHCVPSVEAYRMAKEDRPNATAIETLWIAQAIELIWECGFTPERPTSND